MSRGLLASSFASLSLVACAAILGFDGPVLRDDGDGATDACADGACAAAGRWSALAAVPLGMLGRTAHSAVWTGKEMIVWGGETATGPASDGAAYDPARDSWRALTASPLAKRSGQAAVWSGREMIVWGGTNFLESRFYADGASYDPASGAWATLPPPPSSFRGRAGAIFAWSTTTKELIVWSGATGELEPPAPDGAAYRPESKTWRTIAPAPVDGRTDGVPVWNGTKLVFFGGNQCMSSIGAYCVDGASYDPATDQWAVLPPAPRGVFNGPEGHAGVATGDGGSAATFWGGLQNGLVQAPLSSKGASFDEAAQSWNALQEPGAALARAPRAGVAAFGTRSRLFVWGGVDVAGIIDNGASYDFESKLWAPMSEGGPAGRQAATVVWTGTSAIVWGGSGAALGVYLDDGAIFTP